MSARKMRGKKRGMEHKQTHKTTSNQGAPSEAQLLGGLSPEIFYGRAGEARNAAGNRVIEVRTLHGQVLDAARAHDLAHHSAESPAARGPPRDSAPGPVPVEAPAGGDPAWLQKMQETILEMLPLCVDRQSIPRVVHEMLLSGPMQNTASDTDTQSLVQINQQLSASVQDAFTAQVAVLQHFELIQDDLPPSCQVCEFVEILLDKKPAFVGQFQRIDYTGPSILLPVRWYCLVLSKKLPAAIDAEQLKLDIDWVFEYVDARAKKQLMQIEAFLSENEFDHDAIISILANTGFHAFVRKLVEENGGADFTQLRCSEALIAGFTDEFVDRVVKVFNAEQIYDKTEVFTVMAQLTLSVLLKTMCDLTIDCEVRLKAQQEKQSVLRAMCDQLPVKQKQVDDLQKEMQKAHKIVEKLTNELRSGEFDNGMLTAENTRLSTEVTELERRHAGLLLLQERKHADELAQKEREHAEKLARKEREHAKKLKKLKLEHAKEMEKKLQEQDLMHAEKLEALHIRHTRFVKQKMMLLPIEEFRHILQFRHALTNVLRWWKTYTIFKIDSRFECVVCLNDIDKQERIALPCGHARACANCVQSLTQCPECRAPCKAEQGLRVFM
jgi:hypothetical protein